MRTVLAIILGTVLGTVTFIMVGVVANAIHPTPPELMDPATPEAVAKRVASTPTGVWLSTLFGLALGAFVGGYVGARTARERIVRTTTGIGSLLSLWAVYTLYVVFPDVLWVPLGMLAAAFLLSHLGGSVAMRARARAGAGAG